MDCNINRVKIQSLQNEISKMQTLMNNSINRMSYNDKQEMLDSITDKRREIEKLSRQDSMVIDIPANRIKDRTNNSPSRLSENRCLL